MFSKPFWKSRKVKAKHFIQSWYIKAKLSGKKNTLFLISLIIIKGDFPPKVIISFCLFAKAAAMHQQSYWITEWVMSQEISRGHWIQHHGSSRDTTAYTTSPLKIIPVEPQVKSHLITLKYIRTHIFTWVQHFTTICVSTMFCQYRGCPSQKLMILYRLGKNNNACVWDDTNLFQVITGIKRNKKKSDAE